MKLQLLKEYIKDEVSEYAAQITLKLAEGADLVEVVEDAHIHAYKAVLDYLVDEGIITEEEYQKEAQA